MVDQRKTKTLTEEDWRGRERQAGVSTAEERTTGQGSAHMPQVPIPKGEPREEETPKA